MRNCAAPGSKNTLEMASSYEEGGKGGDDFSNHHSGCPKKLPVLKVSLEEPTELKPLFYLTQLKKKNLHLEAAD